MRKLFIFFGATVGSWVGWYAGSFIWDNPLFAFFCSALVSGFGIYSGWRLGDE